MSVNTKIEWADHTFNPWIGCTKVSPACDHCYAEADFAHRRKVVQWGAGQPRKRTAPSTWAQPLKWNREAERQGIRHRVFCASLADVFDNEVPAQWRISLIKLIIETPHLDWLLLTKRIGNAAPMLETAFRAVHHGREGWADNVPANVWIGATICNQKEADRDIPKLLAVPAAKRFLSMEPLLGAVRLETIYNSDLGEGQPYLHPLIGRVSDGLGDGCNVPQIDWVIVGGESGPGARPMHPDWARSLRDQCQAAGVPYFFKQWGEWGPFVNEAHYTNGGEEKHAHAWVDAETLEHGLCWICDDDGFWCNWTGEPRVLPEGEEDMGRRGALHKAVEVMGKHGKKAAGRLLDGCEWNEVPV